MKLFANPAKPDHATNNARFAQIVKDYPQLAPFQPAPEKAPWHWQAVIDLGGYVQIVNFWPHRMKAQRDGFKSVQGEQAVRGVIEGALEDACRPDPELFED